MRVTSNVVGHWWHAWYRRRRKVETRAILQSNCSQNGASNSRRGRNADIAKANWR
jgi:hypothetical protein